MMTGLGDLVGMISEEDVKELGRLPTFHIIKGEYLIPDNEVLSDKAVERYNRYYREKA